MKVKGPTSGKETSATSKTAKKSAGGSSVQGGAFDSMLATSNAGETSGMDQASAAGSIAQIDVLLMAQEAEDPTQGKARQRMKQRSHKILDALDGIRLKMLGGRLTVGDMINMADVVAAHRERIDDPVLTDLMDEVDLRAQVELAKLRVVLDKKSVPSSTSADHGL